MPIRKRLTDPYGEETKRFDRYLTEGKPPEAPPKPSLKERQPFVEALAHVPFGKTLDKDRFFRTYADWYMTKKFEIWGQTLYILPGWRILPGGTTIECTGATVGRHNPNKRGIKPMLRLRGEQRTWYAQTLHWIEDTVYD